MKNKKYEEPQIEVYRFGEEEILMSGIDDGFGGGNTGEDVDPDLWG